MRCAKLVLAGIGVISLGACVNLGTLAGGRADAIADAAASDATGGPSDGGTGEPEGGTTADGAPDDAPGSTTGCSGALACERAIFVTSLAFTGALGGAPGADAKCQMAADASGHPRVSGRKFVAWISASSSWASTRLPKGTAHYVSPAGVTIATNWDDLTKGSLGHGITEDEHGNPSTSPSAWTGATTFGGTAGDDCEQWQSVASAALGERGDLNSVGPAWTAAGTSTCDTRLPLYCIEY